MVTIKHACDRFWRQLQVSTVQLGHFWVGWQPAQYRLRGERVKLFSDSIIIDGPGQQENEFADDIRGWAAHQKISGKTVDLLIKEGVDSMEALMLIDSV